MATYTKFNQFVEDLAAKVHDLFGTAGSTADTCKAMLTLSAPVSTNAVRGDLTEIANGNGYTTGGQSVANVGARSTGTVTVTATNVTWTASGSAMADFRYVVVYNDTPTSPADPLVAFWDYGSTLTLAVGDSFTIKFNNGASSGTLFTLA